MVLDFQLACPGNRGTFRYCVSFPDCFINSQKLNLNQKNRLELKKLNRIRNLNHGFQYCAVISFLWSPRRDPRDVRLRVQKSRSLGSNVGT